LYRRAGRVSDLLSPLVGAGLLVLAACLVGAVASGRTAWMHRFMWTMPWERHDDETASSNVEFTALVVGIAVGLVGFFFLAGWFVSLID
jgi:uncharacterized iron-regulated membrane protein